MSGTSIIIIIGSNQANGKQTEQSGTYYINDHLGQAIGIFIRRLSQSKCTESIGDYNACRRHMQIENNQVNGREQRGAGAY